MAFNSDLHHRRSIRLHGYDYSQTGAYFVTICIQGRASLLGEVVDGTVHLNKVGRQVEEAWRALPDRFSDVDLDAFVVMPNHMHGILAITNVGALLAAPSSRGRIVSPGAIVWGPKSTPAALSPGGTSCAPDEGAASSAPTVSAVVRAFKSLSAIGCNRLLGRIGQAFWQRNYFENVIRDDDDLERIRWFIAENPVEWARDPDNLDASGRCLLPLAPTNGGRWPRGRLRCRCA